MASFVPPEHALPGLKLGIVCVWHRVARLMQARSKQGLNVKGEHFTDLPRRVVRVDRRLQVSDVAVCKLLRCSET